MIPEEDFNFNSFAELFAEMGVDQNFSEFAWVLDAPDNAFNATSQDFLQAYKDTLSLDKLTEATNNISDFSVLELKQELEETLAVFTELFSQGNLGLKEDRVQFFLQLLQVAVDQINLIPNRKIVQVTIEKISDTAILPTYAHKMDAGADVYASETVEIKPFSTELIKTGLKVEVPIGYEIQIRPRSGMSLKTPIRVANAPGTIDCGYHNEVCVICSNISDQCFTINAGDRIAQMVISQVPMINWVEGKVGLETENRKGGFGSTGA